MTRQPPEKLPDSSVVGDELGDLEAHLSDNEMINLLHHSAQEDLADNLKATAGAARKASNVYARKARNYAQLADRLDEAHKVQVTRMTKAREGAPSVEGRAPDLSHRKPMAAPAAELSPGPGATATAHGAAAVVDEAATRSGTAAPSGGSAGAATGGPAAGAPRTQAARPGSSDPKPTERKW